MCSAGKCHFRVNLKREKKTQTKLKSFQCLSESKILSICRKFQFPRRLPIGQYRCPLRISKHTIHTHTPLLWASIWRIRTSNLICINDFNNLTFSRTQHDWERKKKKRIIKRTLNAVLLLVKPNDYNTNPCTPLGLWMFFFCVMAKHTFTCLSRIHVFITRILHMQKQKINTNIHTVTTI